LAFITDLMFWWVFALAFTMLKAALFSFSLSPQTG